MGKYINKVNDIRFGASYQAKATALLQAGARTIPEPTGWHEGIICLVDNGAFAAAGYAFDANELRVFKIDDGRPKQWWYLENAKDYAE